MSWSYLVEDLRLNREFALRMRRHLYRQMEFWWYRVYNVQYIFGRFFFYAFGFSRLSTKYETTKPPAMRVVSKNVIQNNHHSFYNEGVQNEGVQAIKIRKNGDYNG